VRLYLHIQPVFSASLCYEHDIRLSVRLSIWSSEYWWILITQCNAQWILLIPHERAITLIIWHQQWLMGDAPFHLKFKLEWPTAFKTCQLRQISAYNVSTVRDSKKGLILMNRKSTRGFPMNYRWSASVTPKSPNSGSKR